MQIIYIAAAFAVGAGNAVQLAMISAMGRQRAPLEASWTSLMGTVAGFALVLGIKSLTNAHVVLPAPFDRVSAWAVLAVASSVALGLVMRGLPAYLAITGFFAIALLTGVAFFGPKIGIGLFLGALLAGQLVAAVVLDHIGAFGSPVRHIHVPRALGIVALLGGVALIRGVK